MSKLDVEITALAPEEKWESGVSQPSGRPELERPFVVAGMVIGLLAGLWSGVNVVGKFYFPCMVLGIVLFGTIGGWVYHLKFTPEEKKAANFCPLLSSPLPSLD